MTPPEDSAYYLHDGNFYSGYACSIQQYDETKEEDELIALEIPVNSEHEFMNYFEDPSNFLASQARKGRVEVSCKKATPEEKQMLLEAQQKEGTSVLSTMAARRTRHCSFKPMYGFVHAPRKSWLHVKETLNELKLEAIQCEPCVWVIRDDDGKLIGMVIIHVDDMMIAEDHTNKFFLQDRKEIQQAFEWTPWESKAFVQCGVSIRQNDDFTCSLAQDTYSMNVAPIPVKRGRKPTDGVSDRERFGESGRLGTLGWRAQQSAPWLSSEVSLIQAEIPTATVSTMQKINQIIRTTNDTADVTMVITAIEKLAVVGWGDAAWAARITGESQGGEMIVLAPLSFLDGYTETVAPISWRSCKLPRVARNSASAEVQMMTETLDEISYVRLFIYELECGSVDYTNKQAVNDAISTCPGVLVTDGKSGHDAIEKSECAGLGLRDKRTSIECLGIWQQRQQTGLQIRWVHSDAMLAAGLTKDRAAKALLEFFRSGQRWRLVDHPLHRSTRKRKSEGIDKLDHGTPLDPDIALKALVYFSRDDESQQAGPAGHEALWGR
ncbi:unnamed protein product, partial [Prorocentrum cordatum]